MVIGSSAGGIGALSELFSTLPEDFPAPIVVAQHLDPRRESNLREILARHSKLPVRTVVEHEPLEAGVIFVVPANRHVNVTDSEIDLQIDDHGRPKPSVDFLMSTAAEVFGENLIAVVLSGTGTDGVDGARAVKRAGGTVVIQDPKTAEFGGMPGSLAPSTVDIVANIDRIGPILSDLLSQVATPDASPRAEEQRVFEHFLEELRDQHGVDFTSYKTSTIMRRLKRRMAATDTESIESYRHYLESHPEEYRRLINAFLIKVTEFFRDAEFFGYLREEILPELIREARAESRQLRIWSAGCATGEEAYSLAMILHELLDGESGLFNVRIFATDMDEDAINFARQGIYPSSALGDLSEEQIERYFEMVEGQYQIKKQVRNMIVFGEHDLARRSPFPRVDLVVSRNVLIYFTTELQRRALQLFAYSLRDGGYLALGKSETVSPFAEFFEPAHRHHKVYRRRGERFLIPPTISVSPALAPRVRPAHNRETGHVQHEFVSQRGSRQARFAEEGILNRIPVGVVIVNRRYDIQEINVAARRLLGVRGVAVGEDLLHLLQDVPYAEVRRVIDAAFRGGEDAAVTGEFSVANVSTGETRYIRLACHPLKTEGERSVAQSVAIVATDVTQDVRARHALEEQLSSVQTELERTRREAEAEAVRQTEQNERLIEENRRLEAANRELTDLNAELQVANEETLISAEEAQAATEEVETLNEELQATNEELETLNEELQATIEELNTTNDDLQARSAELQELARTREEERRAAEASSRRLEAILSGMRDAVLSVNAEGRILFSNEVFTEIFGDGERGEPDADPRIGNLIPLNEAGERIPHEQTPQYRASRAETFELRFAVDKDGKRRLFEARGHPIDEDTGGGVIVIREITEH